MDKDIAEETKNRLRNDIDMIISDLKDNKIYSSTIHTAEILLSNLKFWYDYSDEN